MKFFLLNILLIIPSLFTGETDTLNQYIEYRMEVEQIPGMSIAIIESDGQITFKNIGYVDTDKRQPVDEHTIYEIGSITKTFTAGLIHTLLDEAGKEPETTYYEDSKISVHHLLTHHSGLPRLPDNLQPQNPADPYRDYTDSLMHDFFNNYQPEHEPGSQFSYSNLGYMILGNLVEITSGKSYDEAIQHYVTSKLNMSSTSRQLADSARFATPTVGGIGVHEWNFDGVKGLGELRSTTSDLAEYLKMMMGHIDYPYGNSFRETVNPRTSIEDRMEIAHSWFINRQFNDEIIYHVGYTGGSSTFIGYSTVSGKGVVILSNSNQSIVDIGLHLLNSSYSLKEVKEYIQPETSDLEKLAGVYLSEALPEFTVFNEDGQLFGKMNGQQALPLHAISETEFENRSVQAKIVFEINRDRAHSLTLHQGGQSFPFEWEGTENVE